MIKISRINPIRLLRNEMGQALVLVLLYMLLGGVLIAAVLSFVSSGHKIQSANKSGGDELYAADAGVRDALWHIKYDHLQYDSSAPVDYSLYAAPDDTTAPGGHYDPYNYTSEWATQWTVAPSPPPVYEPKSLTVASGTGQVNNLDVGYSVKNVWVPGTAVDISGYSSTQLKNIIEKGNTTGDTSGTTGRLIVKGFVTSDVTTDTPTIPNYQITVSYTPGASETLNVKTIGIWIPAGFTYVAGSSNLETGTSKSYYPQMHVSSTDSPGGKNIIWSFDALYPPFAGGTGKDPFPDVNSSESTMMCNITFKVIRDAATSTSKELEAVSWMTTDGVSAIPFAWDDDKKVYEINSSTVGSSGTDVKAYTVKSKMRTYGSAIGGDYLAIGNSLMRDTDHDGYVRDTLDASSDSTASTIPANAEVQAAYLYWSGWLSSGTNKFSDSCSSYGNWTRSGSSPYTNTDWGPASSITYFRGHHGTSTATGTRNLTKTSAVDLSGNPADSIVVSWKQWEDAMSPVFTDTCSTLNLTSLWNNGGDWLYVSPGYQATHTGTGASTRRTLTLKNPIDLSSYGAATVAWDQWISTPITLFSDAGTSPITTNWVNGTDWSYNSSGYYQGTHNGVDANRTLDLKTAVDLSSHNPSGTVKVSWDQWLTVSAPVFGPDLCDNINNWTVSTASTPTPPKNVPTGDGDVSGYWGVGAVQTLLKNPTANANGTNPWTNPADAYTSNNIRATAVATIPTLRATGTVIAGTTAAITPGLPSGLVADDICILVASTIAGGSVSITANGSIGTWTPVTGSPIDVTGGEKLYVWWGRFSSGSTPPSVQATTDHCIARITAYSNCYAGGSPIDVTTTGTETTSDTSFSFTTGLTSTYNNELAICVVSTGRDATSTSNFSTMTNTSLASLAERMDNTTVNGLGGGFGLDQGTLSTAGSVGTWESTLSVASSKAYICFTLMAKTPNNTFDQIYGTFGITGSTTITKVELGYEAHATATQKLDFYVSTDGGSSWSSVHTTANLATSDPGAYTYIDVTSDASWTWALLNDSNFKIKMVTNWVNGTPTWSVDALIVRVSSITTANKYAVIDENGTTIPTNDGDYITGTGAGTDNYALFTAPAFSLPAGATITNLTVYYRAKDPVSGANNIRAAIEVGGTVYDTIDSGSNPGTSFYTYSYLFTTNPKTGLAWTAADINGTGTNPLQQFGIASNDLNPDIQVSMVYAQVNYTLNTPLWSSVSGELQGQGSGSATDDQRTITLKTALNLSTYSSGALSISWNQRASSNLTATDHFYYALYNGTWGSNIEVFNGNNPASSFSVVIPDTYLVSNFKIRFFCDLDTADKYVYLDNISVGSNFTSSDGLDFSFFDGTSWSTPITAFRYGDAGITTQPTSNNFSYRVPAAYLASGFKLRFSLVGGGAGFTCKIDDITITPYYSSMDGLNLDVSTDDFTTFTTFKAFRNNIGTTATTQTYNIPSQYMAAGFKLRFSVVGCGVGLKCNIDNITVTSSYGASDGLDFLLYDGSQWSSPIKAFRGNITNTAPASRNFSYVIPFDYLKSGFKIMFTLVGCGGTGQYVNIDDIYIDKFVADTAASFKIDGTQVYFNGTTPASGAAVDLTADTSQVIPNYNSDGTPNGFSYACYKDVSALVKTFSQTEPSPATNHTGNGVYSCGGVNGTTGNQWSYAAWSLILIYSSPDTQGHQLYLFDKFRYVHNYNENGEPDFDEDGNPGGVIGGFLVPQPIPGETNAAAITCFVGDGDEGYTGDSFKFTRVADNSSQYIIDDNNDPVDNVWNSSSLVAGADGVDIDTFYITWASGLLQPGDAQARIDLPTGVDSWNLVYTIISFRSSVTSGGTINYLITKH